MLTIPVEATVIIKPDQTVPLLLWTTSHLHRHNNHWYCSNSRDSPECRSQIIYLCPKTRSHTDILVTLITTPGKKISLISVMLNPTCGNPLDNLSPFWFCVNTITPVVQRYDTYFIPLHYILFI